MQAADEFSTNLQAITERCNYPTQLVFNVDETGLFWKRMPSLAFIASEEKSASRFKAAKDRLTLSCLEAMRQEILQESSTRRRKDDQTTFSRLILHDKTALTCARL